ncbi:MAG: IPTL-CTERM sorting domain-containing protein [Candidatus Solibacter sp.]|nr:IPTL-CTERM sorting domain-containing protein [Candidatus Solibacter sp.]
MRNKWLLRAVWVIGIAVLQVCQAQSGPALIVHDGTAGIESDVLANLTGKLTAAGYTVTANVGVPGGSLAANRQIWDIRFNNTTPLTGSDITAYVAYMAGGRSLFVMGENTGFATRNNSIIALVQSAGGGTITVGNPANNVQTVQSPFTGPNALATVTFLAAAGSPSPANGAYVTRDGSNIGASLAFGPGNMANAAAGSLLIVFDVNFLQASADANSQTFSNNLVAYLAAPVVIAPPPSSGPAPSAAPSLSEWGMVLLAGGLIFVAARRLRAPDGAHLE